VVLFTHNGFCQYLIREALNIEKQTFDFAINNTALTKIEFLRSGQIILHGVNL
jgi:broad specificity phosphatase PhoE